MTSRLAPWCISLTLLAACDPSAPVAEDAGARPDAALDPRVDAYVPPGTDAALDPRVDAYVPPGTDAGACVRRECADACGELPDGCGGTLSCGACPAGRATSLTQYGITWFFDGEREVGQFVNGDWWVVGPVRITSITPEPTGVRNGSMVNPIGTQAYDDRAPFDPDAVVELPRTLMPGESLVSSISNPEEPDCMMGSTPAWRLYNGDCERGVLHTQAILTVLDAPAPPDAFRPPYSGDAKPLHRVAEICWDALPTLAPPAELPDVEYLLRHVERPWIDHVSSYTHRDSCATQNWLCYGREVGEVVSQLAAYALLDAPRRRDVAIRLVQLGIDNYGVLQAGGSFPSNGGHSNGHKFPIVFAGLLLGDPGMSSPDEPGVEIGNEDAMTYLADDGTARWGRACESCYLENACSYGGACRGGPKDCRDPSGESDACGDYRVCCTSHTWVGEALAIRLMGGMAAWGHDPFFAYVDRWVEGDVEGGGGAPAFVGDVWAMHRDAAPIAGRCP
jgi:hypothetical protein